MTTKELAERIYVKWITDSDNQTCERAAQAAIVAAQWFETVCKEKGLE